MDAAWTTKQLVETIDEFERQKIRDIEKIFSEFVFCRAVVPWQGLGAVHLGLQKYSVWTRKKTWRGTDVHRGEELDSLDFTCEAAAEESPDEDADHSHDLDDDEEDFSVFCCDEGQLSVIQSSTLRTIKSPRALEHGTADAKCLYGNITTDSNRDIGEFLP
ncbi:uncharacterized protein LOC144995648 [Oryzias latipes]